MCAQVSIVLSKRRALITINKTRHEEKWASEFLFFQTLETIRKPACVIIMVFEAKNSKRASFSLSCRHFDRSYALLINNMRERARYSRSLSSSSSTLCLLHISPLPLLCIQTRSFTHVHAQSKAKQKKKALSDDKARITIKHAIEIFSDLVIFTFSVFIFLHLRMPVFFVCFEFFDYRRSFSTLFVRLSIFMLRSPLICALNEILPLAFIAALHIFISTLFLPS